MRIANHGRIALLALGTAGLTALVFACGFDPPEKNPNPPSSSSGSGACKAGPGELPPPDCDNSSNECTGGICTAGSSCCKVEAKCGDTTTCMPLGDNKGKTVLDLRIRRLNVATPPSLADVFIQNVVLTQNIDLKANGKGGTLACGESGQGSFNWMLHIDKNAGTMETGGAPPTEDFLNGYCFYNQTVNGTKVTSASTKVTFTGDTFDADPIPKLNVPIFVGGNINNAVILPLSQATFKKVTLSADNNCVGKFNPTALAKDCSEDGSSCQKWKTAGVVGGFITLEESDNVDVKDLGSSLCVVLTKATEKAPGNKCPRGADGKIKLKGDYCSTTQKAGDCADSYWLAATFAASAAKLTDGSTVPECQGKSSVTDAGPDGDATTDAPVDAPVDSPADGPVDAPAG